MATTDRRVRTFLATAPTGRIEIRVERAAGARIGRAGGAERWRATATAPPEAPSALASGHERPADRDEPGRSLPHP